MNLPHIAYDNLLRSATLVAVTGAEVVGFEHDYICDWRDFTTFRPVASAVGTYTSFVEYTCSKAATITAWIAWFEDTVPSTATVKIEAEINPGAGYVNSIVLTGGGKQISGGPVAKDTTAMSGWAVIAGCRIKVSFSGFNGSNGVRQVFVGPSFVAQTGQYDGVAPTVFTAGLVVENVISVNGSVLGRNIRRQEKNLTLDLQYLTEAWVRLTWEPFAVHAARYPFFYRWNPVDYPSDLAFAVADQVQAPKNSQPPGTMAVSMPMKVTV